MKTKEPNSTYNVSSLDKCKAFLAWNGILLTVIVYNISVTYFVYRYLSSRTVFSIVITCLPFFFFGQLSQFILPLTLLVGGTKYGEELHDGAPWPQFAREWFVFKFMRRYLNLKFGEIPKELEKAEAEDG